MFIANDFLLKKPQYLKNHGKIVVGSNERVFRQKQGLNNR